MLIILVTLPLPLFLLLFSLLDYPFADFYAFNSRSVARYTPKILLQVAALGVAAAWLDHT